MYTFRYNYIAIMIKFSCKFREHGEMQENCQKTTKKQNKKTKKNTILQVNPYIKFFSSLVCNIFKLQPASRACNSTITHYECNLLFIRGWTLGVKLCFKVKSTRPSVFKHSNEGKIDYAISVLFSFYYTGKQ